MTLLQPTASGTPGARGAAALSLATADGRGECGCVRGWRWRVSSATAPERKSESAATSAVQVSAGIMSPPTPSRWKRGDNDLFGVDGMSHYVRSGRTNARVSCTYQASRILTNVEITPSKWVVTNLWCRGYPRNHLFQTEDSCHHSSVTACWFKLKPHAFNLRYLHTSRLATRRNPCIRLEMLKWVFPFTRISPLSFPAPYEICPEDYAVSMVWRRTPSGELAFNRCPPNATGTDTGAPPNVSFTSVLVLLPLPWDGTLIFSVARTRGRTGGGKGRPI